MAVGLRAADRRDARGIDDLLHPGVRRRPQQVSRSLDIRTLELCRLRRPQPVVGGDVEKKITALERAFQRFGLREVSHHDVYPKTRQIRSRRSPPHKTADGDSLGEEFANDVASNEAGPTCNKGFHR